MKKYIVLALLTVLAAITAIAVGIEWLASEIAVVADRAGDKLQVWGEGK